MSALVSFNYGLGDDQEKLNSVLHFKEEEKVQKDVDYPGLEEHIKKHEEFRHTVKELYDYLDENEGPDENFMEQVKINVIDWLFGHIKTFDRSVAEYINIYDNPERL